MVLTKHNYLKSGIFFNPIFIPGFSGLGFSESRLLRSESRVRVQGPGTGSKVRVQGPGYRSSPF